MGHHYDGSLSGPAAAAYQRWKPGMECCTSYGVLVDGSRDGQGSILRERTWLARSLGAWVGLTRPRVTAVL